MTNIKPPTAIEAEALLIGAVIISPDMFPEVATVTPADFTLTKNARLWQAIIELSKANAEIDSFTVGRQVGADFADMGGSAYIADILSRVPTGYAAPGYSRAVLDASYNRAAITWASELAKQAYAGNVGAVEKAINEASKTLAARTAQPNAFTEALLQVTEQLNNPNVMKSQYVTSGFRAFDEMLGGGWERGELSILAARPGMGKSAYAFQNALYAARAGQRVAIFSLEMNAAAVVRRMVGQLSQFNWLDHRRGAADDDRIARAKDAINQLAAMPIYIYDSPMSTAQARATVAQLVGKVGSVDLVIADHLRLFADSGERESTRLGAISWALKQIAKANNCAVVCAAQLNRGTERRDNKRPALSDLRESGEIEENAGAVVGIYRGGYYDSKDTTAELIALKARDGQTASHFEARWVAETTSFVRLTQD